ncbi:phosphatidate cytidylyltransferase [Hirsutella rhossiliensis]|uniref:dolichol kinase n=1 Tax=Hirsutella rhossiliensis TaxID=111463 RepID=A0A9P8SJS7_9HYPO|nr:phosphatidate cytidylyltransferase [Hirsutella rhossiliensis]KAH0965221.1 phosphatidate cytidylyltransferase [Hirsutella rhossiliensis]
MPERPVHESSTALDPADQQPIRALNRTPKPYHHQSAELPHPADRFVVRDETPDANNAEAPSSSSMSFGAFSKDSSPASDSGTEADDEHFLKGLPAPKVRLHKGLRGHNEFPSGVSTPLATPAAVEDDPAQAVEKDLVAQQRSVKRHILDAARRNKVLVRRATEACLVAALGCMVGANPRVSPLMSVWRRDFHFLNLLVATLLALYPLRATLWAHRHRQPSRALAFKLPSDFDPAPLLYPPTITIFTSLLVSTSNPAAVLPSIVLSICAIPQSLIPTIGLFASFDAIHWALSCLPLIWRPFRPKPHGVLLEETLVLLYPLHQTLCNVLRHLTTTSLLEAELQLLSIALISVLVLAASPQVQVLKALLWVGGLSTLVICGPVIKLGIRLARVPKWRFRRPFDSQQHQSWKPLRALLPWRSKKQESPGQAANGDCHDSNDSAREEDGYSTFRGPLRIRTLGSNTDLGEISPLLSKANGEPDLGLARRRTVSHIDMLQPKSLTHTASGRRKRAFSSSLRPFLKLTQAQATLRTWLYALYVYVCLLAIILIGVRAYVQEYALGGNEPIGWALGYVLGDWPWFRFQVVKANLERWVCLPERSESADGRHCTMGWVQHLRHDEFGEANSRLILSGYWLLILVVGLVIVFRLKETYEVDTRRKVFHFMMVGMFLPGTFVDPAFAALGLVLALAVFLILDLLRASQLPPLSKPIATFLAPYVDGRDFRGPVVISHIFLLIGCAIPLWEVSMVSGVICVGLGDAAASLIGRRYGHRKWLWGGGKSLEGSVAFAAAVFAGLAAASAWLRLGGWPTTDEPMGPLVSARNAGVCASMASLTEAVLTGGNDNVIVPVVLWTCVKSLGV